MITMLHGDNVQASREALIALKGKYKNKEVRQLSGKNIDETKLIQALESSSLFGDETAVFIENIFTVPGANKTKQLERYCSLLSSAPSDIVLWEGKEISKTAIAMLGKTTNIQEFKIPVVIFQLLDNLKPNNTKTLLELYEKTLSKDAAELIHAMLVRRVRELIVLSDGVTPPGLQSWQVSRLTSQAKFFTMEKLVSLYKKLFDIELTIKTGTSPFSMKDALELWLTEV